MNPRRVATVLAWGVFFSPLPLASAANAPPLSARVEALEGRLAALSPDKPADYLELGELVMQEAATPDDRRLARELLVLALTTATRPGPANPQRPSDVAAGTDAPRSGIASSACLALATLADDAPTARWLAAVGASLAPDTGLDASPQDAASAAARDPAALDLATLLGLVRTGDGRRAERLLARPGVSDLLERFDKVLVPGIGGGAQRVRRMIELYPACPQCRNRRSIKDAGGVQVCPTCKGLPGPNLPGDELVNHLRAESVLLSGVQRSWAAQILADEGAPLRDLDPAEVAATLRVDPAKTIWRNNAWTDPTPAKPASAKPAPGKPGPATPPPPEQSRGS